MSKRTQLGPVCCPSQYRKAKGGTFESAFELAHIFDQVAFSENQGALYSVIIDIGVRVYYRFELRLGHFLFAHLQGERKI